MSGYDIRKTVQQSIRHFWSESYGQIYPALKRLEAAGLIERARGAQTGRAGRQVYAITKAGRLDLKKWLGEAPAVMPPRNELLLKLFFGRQVPRQDLIEHLWEFGRRQEELLASYEQVSERLRTQPSGHADLPFWRITLSYGAHQSRSLLDWSAEAMAELKKGGVSRGRSAKR